MRPTPASAGSGATAPHPSRQGADHQPRRFGIQGSDGLDANVFEPEFAERRTITLTPVGARWVGSDLAVL